jgi:hypothetical protein
MKIIRNSVLFGLAIGAVSVLGCSSQSAPGLTGNSNGGYNTGVVGAGAPGASSQTGTVTLQLQLAPGITLSSVQYTVTNATLAGFSTITGSVDVSGSQSVGFSLTLPVAGGYSLSLSATDSNGDSCSAGPASFGVTADQTNTVAVTLACSETIDAGFSAPDVNVGTVVVTADASLDATIIGSACAAATSLTASPNETLVGNTISLTAAGIDPSYLSSDVTLTWGGSGGFGALASNTGSSNTFTCNAAGTETITVTAAISNGGASCPNVGSLTVILRCDAVVDASTVDSGIDASTVDAGIDTGTADTGIDAGTGSGGPVTACTTAPCAKSGANSVQCPASANGVCTPTEAIIIAHDILKNGQLAGAPKTTSCYSCLVLNACLDSSGDAFPAGNGSGVAIPDSECGDPNGAGLSPPFDNPNVSSASAAATQACLDALTCVLTSNGANPASECTLSQAPPSVSNCYCGAHTGSTCLSSPAAAIGVCASIIDTDIGSTDPTTVLSHFTDTTYSGGGVGLAVLNCGLTAPATPPAAAKCPTCFN